MSEPCGYCGGDEEPATMAGQDWSNALRMLEPQSSMLVNAPNAVLRRCVAGHRIRADRAALLEVLEAILREAPDDDPPNAPGHAHERPYRWDNDGSTCRWCQAWSDAKHLLLAAKEATGTTNAAERSQGGDEA